MDRNMDDWKKAGRIAAECLQFGKLLIKPNVKLIDVAKETEEKIKELGGKPAFPVNISLNNVAAHDTPAPEDERFFKEDIVKLDVGVSYNGAIGDTALTVNLSNKNERLVEASKKALEEAIKLTTPGTLVSEIGKKVEETIKSYGFEPIRNLSGHGLDENVLHNGLSIPNYDTKGNTRLKKGDIVAIEPFATNGAGSIIEGNHAEIFMLVQKKSIRIGREILSEIEKFNGLPFCTRWLTEKFPLFKVNIALKLMNQQGIIRLYPTLPESKQGLISQHEHTVFVDDTPLILTKLN